MNVGPGATGCRPCTKLKRAKNITTESPDITWYFLSLLSGVEHIKWLKIPPKNQNIGF